MGDSLLVFFFHKTARQRSAHGGIGYGFWMGLLATAPVLLGTFSRLTVPSQLAVPWFVFFMFESMICGAAPVSVSRYREANPSLSRAVDGPREHDA